jgi:hypothetical protein
MELLEAIYRFGQVIFEPIITGPDPMDIFNTIDDYVRWIFGQPPREP